MALRVYHPRFFFVNLQQLVFLHEHVNYDCCFGQVADSLGSLNHDVTWLCPQNNLGKDAHRVLPRFYVEVHLLLVFFGDLELLRANLRHAVESLALHGALNHFADRFFILEQLCLAYTDDLLVAAFVRDQLVQRLEAEQRCLVVLRVLQQWHYQGPKEHLDNALMLLGCSPTRDSYKRKLMCTYRPWSSSKAF